MIGDAIGVTGVTTIAEWLQLICTEYAEVPGLHLTKPQVQDLCALDPWVCDALLNALVDAGFLRRTGDDAYVRGPVTCIRELRGPRQSRSNQDARMKATVRAPKFGRAVLLA
jgi:hypothetical protein